jgi:hypothetical protein
LMDNILNRDQGFLLAPHEPSNCQSRG